MSLYCLTFGQCLRSTFLGYSSISQKATVLNPPVASNPRENPPMPLNRSRCFNYVAFFPVLLKLILVESEFLLEFLDAVVQLPDRGFNVSVFSKTSHKNAHFFHKREHVVHLFFSGSYCHSKSSSSLKFSSSMMSLMFSTMSFSFS